MFKTKQKYKNYFVKQNVCPSISWNSVQESSYTQVLINIIYCRGKGMKIPYKIYSMSQVLKTIKYKIMMHESF